MLRGSQRGGDAITGSALIRLLTRLTEVDAPESRQAFAERLSQWLGWADAISLSAALSSGTPPAPMAASAPGAADKDAADPARVRAGLVKALADAGAAATMNNAAADPADGDFSPHRRHYHAQQQAMEHAIGPLRNRLRARLAGRSPAMARLAAVDAVMDQVLGPRERALLSTVPVLLERRFEQLRLQHAPEGPAPGWMHRFRQDMHSVLLAELEIRLQPAEGLLAALREPPRPVVHQGPLHNLTSSRRAHHP
ncbi:MAG: DUF3348 domain-containing protein [Vitreoscilla sp.]|nr:DUF3348 domain-containing protein [Vitreoscilla sp.]